MNLKESEVEDKSQELEEITKKLQFKDLLVSDLLKLNQEKDEVITNIGREKIALSGLRKTKEIIEQEVVKLNEDKNSIVQQKMGLTTERENLNEKETYLRKKYEDAGLPFNI